MHLRYVLFLGLYSTFKFDRQWEADPGYFCYDFRAPEALLLSAGAGQPAQQQQHHEDLPRGGFDVVVIDPPFITHEARRMHARLPLVPSLKHPYSCSHRSALL
jgi:hypothetical protein